MTEYVNELDRICVLDLETSGTDQQRDQVLEVHAIFGRVDSGGFHPSMAYQRVLPLVSDPDKWDPIVIKMHTDNGLLEESRAVAAEAIGDPVNLFSLADVDLLFLAEGAKYTLMGNTVHFDLGFVRRVFPQFAKMLSHRVLDVSGARLFCQSLGMAYPGKSEPAHRAKQDCEQSIAFYAQYQKWVRALALGVP